MDYRYPALFSPEPDGGYLVQFVDFDEAFTEGDTLQEAQFNASEVLTLTLDGRLEEGQAIPAPSLNLANAQYIAPDAHTQTALRTRESRFQAPPPHSFAVKPHAVHASR